MMKSSPPKPNSEESLPPQIESPKVPDTPKASDSDNKKDAPQSPLSKDASSSLKELAVEAGVKKDTNKESETKAEAVSVQEIQDIKDEGTALAPMRSLLTHFALEFCQKIEPLCSPLNKLEGIISDLPKKSCMHKILPELRDVRHHIQALLEKVNEQQAYVLIFGPLKSGKSTLMNAICASYVSEVTSLPAYPCLVNISYAEKADYQAVQYDGKIENFADQDELHRTIQKAHVALTNKLREVEENGDTFDPVVHMPAAFRKIDIKLNTQELATSSAVLVDTPGLYSRMKFGYDQMTRDFRNTAACAIFVVKSDNLFLEQVFEEFTELLELFSRIFLIVNLDSRKMDLNAKGELVPSLEQKNPEKIIEAFQDLAMSAPLKDAVDDGRLRIYPVDLLSAASGRIQANKESKGGAKQETSSVKRFDNLRGDLIEFLNSNDYLKSFLVDSVRRGSSLLDQLQVVLKSSSFVQIKTDIEKSEVVKNALLNQCQSTSNLNSENWHGRSSELVEEVENEIKNSAAMIKKSANEEITEILLQWWQDDSSLHDLTETKIKPYFEKTLQSYLDGFSECLQHKTANTNAGLNLSDSINDDLKTLKIDLRSLVEKSLEQITPEPLSADLKPKIAEIPVKKRFLDWLLFRSAHRVKKDVFGDKEKPDQNIPALIKGKRLGEAGREVMLNHYCKNLTATLDDATLALPKESVTKYVDAIIEKIARICESKDQDNKKEIADKEKGIAANTSVLEESTLIKKKVTELDQFIKKTYPLPNWPDTQSESKSKTQ